MSLVWQQVEDLAKVGPLIFWDYTGVQSQSNVTIRSDTAAIKTYGGWRE